MTERPISLDLRMPSSRSESGPQSGMGTPTQPGDDSRARFAQAMKAADLAPPAAAPAEAALSHPMGLFGGAASATSAQAAVNPGVLDLLRQSVGGLQIGQEQRSVRMDLADDLYPGVSVSVFEDAGAWVAEFRCTEADSFQSLATPAQDMARQLANDLGRDAVWRVIDESQGPVADHDTDHITEAFASAP
jgi:hypothetical protein